jgi:hypothetical protein
MNSDPDSRTGRSDPDRKGLWFPYGVLLAASLIMILGLVGRSGEVSAEVVVILVIDGLATVSVIFLSRRSRERERGNP